MTVFSKNAASSDRRLDILAKKYCGMMFHRSPLVFLQVWIWGISEVGDSSEQVETNAQHRADSNQKTSLIPVKVRYIGEHSDRQRYPIMRGKKARSSTDYSYK